MASPSPRRPHPKACASTSKGVAKVTGGRLDADRQKSARRFCVPTPKSPPHFRKLGHIHHQSGLLHRFERQPARTCRGALRREGKPAKSSPVRLQLPGRPMLLGRWSLAVLTQKHRWTRESVSEKAKSEKDLSAGHHGETGRSLNVGHVLPVDGTFTLWRKVSGIFWFDFLWRGRLHAARFFGMESHGQFVCRLRVGWLLVSMCVTVRLLLWFLPCFPEVVVWKASLVLYSARGWTRKIFCFPIWALITGDRQASARSAAYPFFILRGVGASQLQQRSRSVALGACFFRFERLACVGDHWSQLVARCEA